VSRKGLQSAAGTTCSTRFVVSGAPRLCDHKTTIRHESTLRENVGVKLCYFQNSVDSLNDVVPIALFGKTCLVK
jgi:hypothetical protein